MCVRVRFASLVTTPYDAARRIITVPVGLNPRLTLRAVRAVLAELGAPQQPDGAVCWCGAPVHLWDGTIPAQRVDEVSPIGA